MRSLTASLIFCGAFVTAVMGQEYEDREPITVSHPPAKSVKLFYAEGSVFKMLPNVHFKEAGFEVVDGELTGNIFTAVCPPPGSYLLNANGEVFIINVLGDNVPPDDGDPDDPSDPNVPTDPYDNIGQRVYGWTKGLDRNNDLARLLNDFADELELMKKSEVSAAVGELYAEIRDLINGDSGYNDFRQKYSQDLNDRWIEDNWGSQTNLGEIVAKYHRAVAVGLGAGS